MLILFWVVMNFCREKIVVKDSATALPEMPNCRRALTKLESEFQAKIMVVENFGRKPE